MNEFLGKSFEIFCSIFDFVIVITYFKVLFESKEANYPRVIKYVTYTVVAVILIVFMGLNNPPIVNIAISLVTLFVITLFYDATALNRIFSILAFQVFAMVAEIMSYSLVNVINYNQVDEISQTGIDYMMIFLSKVLMFLMVVIVSMVMKRKSRRVSIQYHICLIVVPLVTTLAANSVFVSSTRDDGMLGTLDYMSIVGLMVMNILVFYMLDNIILASELREKNSQLETQFEYQEKKYEQTSTSYKKIKGLIHDTNKHLTYIDSCIGEKQYDEAQEYIRTAMDKMERSYTRINTGFLVVDALVSNAYDLARQNSIIIKTNIKIDPQSINIERYDISVALGNMLDNAIEACKKISNVDDRFVEINIFTTETALVIGIINSTLETKGEVNLKTDKPNKDFHGIGIDNVKNICDKYGGNFLIETEEAAFSATAVLPLKESKIPLRA